MDSFSFDVVVVGGGIAGLTAGNRAAELGLRVALFERGSAERYLCNSRMAGGVLHIAFKNIKDRPEAIVEAVQAATKGHADPELVSVLANTSARAGDWIKKEGAKFVRMSFAVDWQSWVMAPPRRIRPGMDWEWRGPDYTLRTLTKNLLGRKGTIFRGAEARGLLESQGRCVGVEIVHHGLVREVTARSVIIADGGFQGNLELLRKHVCSSPEKLKQRGASTGIGDGLMMAEAFGAEICDLSYFYGHMLSRDAFTNDQTWPYPQLDELGVAGVVVGGDGRRFADEGRGGVALANAIAKLDDPQSAWVIFDSAVWEGPGRNARIPANPHLIKAGGTVLSAPTLSELAMKAGLPRGPLEQTILEHREAVLSRNLDGLMPARSSGAGQLWALNQPPYYAAPLCAGVTYTLGGIGIDSHARVRSKAGSPIPGLYAAGATTAGLEGREGPTYIGGLMKGIVFGMRAAEHAASALGQRG
ncbi:FAD-dependent oxidoreductase [Caballeronia sp. GAWG2-1]|uniref:FAD-dependent oxidoreductase n=1 Tax=Caballeronia sp. GAWG2-1 TaxID=2921744 RepID=UPI0020282BCA|nr:FAD-dependent oxidoreductase [Caballeronia sp. GAWG2-1]